MKQQQRLKNWDKSLQRERKELWSLLLESSERGGLGGGGGWGGRALGSLCAAELGLTATCLDHTERSKGNIQVGRRGKGRCCCWVALRVLKVFVSACFSECSSVWFKKQEEWEDWKGCRSGRDLYVYVCECVEEQLYSSMSSSIQSLCSVDCWWFGFSSRQVSVCSFIKAFVFISQAAADFYLSVCLWDVITRRLYTCLLQCAVGGGGFLDVFCDV